MGKYSCSKDLCHRYPNSWKHCGLLQVFESIYSKVHVFSVEVTYSVPSWFYYRASLDFISVCVQFVITLDRKPSGMLVPKEPGVQWCLEES